jgi:hypothetical protein
MTNQDRVIPPALPEKKRTKKRELTAVEWEAKEARTALRLSFYAGVVCAAIGALLVHVSQDTARVTLADGVRISLGATRDGGVYVVGLTLLALGSICLSVAVIGWGVSLGVRSARDS